MTYLLDSDVFSDYLWLDPDITETVESLVPAGLAISIITYMETFEGTFYQSDVVSAQQQFSIITSTVPILAFDESVARRCAALRDALRKQRKRVRQRALDLMIAATAIEYDLELVTRNWADYDDITGLKLYRSL